MFEKISKWFKSKPKVTSASNDDFATNSNDDTPLMDNQEVAGVPNTEFSIRYNRNKASVHRLTPIGRELYVTDPTKVDTKLDTMAFILHCPKHDKVAVYEDPNCGIRWLPFTPSFIDKSWIESAISGILLILSNNEEEYFKLKKTPPFTSVELLEILRIQMPQTLNLLTRMIFYVKMIPTESNNCTCCSPGHSITWTSIKELSHGAVSNIWGPELVQYARLVASDFDGFVERIEEFSLDDVYLYSPRDPPSNAEETMLLQLRISEKTIEILYADFLDHCYPCFSLPIHSFRQYMSKYGFKPEDDRLDSLFMAFNYKKCGYVSFHELLMGLVALEPLAGHQETRIKFIFRFYDPASKGYLDQEDFNKLVFDMHPNLEGNERQAKLEECADKVKWTTRNGQRIITFARFMEAIADLHLRGTSKLCRSSVPVFMQLTKAMIRKTSSKPFSDDLKEWKNIKSVIIPQTHKGVCKRCQARKYKLATHVVSLDLNGHPCNPIRLVSKQTKAAPIDRHSVDFVFNPKSISNHLLQLIRDFSKRKGTVRSPRGLLDGAKAAAEMYDLLSMLVKEAKPVLKVESRCPNISSPVYVVGDIHGNIEDLLTLEKLLWKSAPCFGPGFLFLGDYVDRGKWGFECVVYLVALKLLDPAKVTLLRGNHEVRTLQEKYSYKKECYFKYGPEIGQRIWQLTNELFDMFPLAATIDNKVFCTHGGLSPNAHTLEQIRHLPSPMANPEQQSKIAWDLLWSDPIHNQQFKDIAEWTEAMQNHDFAQEGYLYNAKRGAAYLFNEHAANTFLCRNSLSHMIRAHEVPPLGYAHHFQNQVTTVFSCSHYCNNDNEAAVMLVDNNSIRAIKVDTQNNAPATDK